MKLHVSSLPSILTAAAVVYMCCVGKSPAPIYMKFDGIPGEVTTSPHESWIELQSMAFGLGRAITNDISTEPREVLLPTFGDVVVTKSVDASTPELQVQCAGGEMTNVVIELTEVSTNAPIYYTIHLEDVLVSSYQTQSQASNRPMESVSLNFAKIQWTYYQGPSVYEKWQGSYDLETGEALHVHVTPTDDDGDGVENGADNCPSGHNSNQANHDTDGLGDVCDDDDDGDAMPDGYEMANGLNPIVDDRLLDADGDGSSNFNEFRAGTQAGNPLSVFKVRMLQVGTTNGVLTWGSVSNRQYWVSFSPSVAGPYTDMGVVPSGGAQTSIPVPVNAAQRFYKVTLQTPLP